MAKQSAHDVYYCGVCRDQYIQFADRENWIGCEACDNWFHFACVEIIVETVPDKFFMVQSCFAYGCSNGSGQNKGLKFYNFSKRPAERSAGWIAAVKCDNWQPNEHSRVCSAHFVTGLLIHVTKID